MVSVTVQSEDHRDVLNIIDKLRPQGIDTDFDFPEIIVCGDQSSGKSSVLEAISGIEFPTGEHLCTRFATELLFRRHDTPAVKVSIIPGPERSITEKNRLGQFTVELDAADPDMELAIGEAKEVMSLSEVKAFSTDVLRVELCGPAQSHLTMVDLPGLLHAGNRDQSVKDAAIVREMAQGYMKWPRCIILAIISAESSFDLQQVTKIAREFDPRGYRTLGVIIKPDALEAGSDGEAAFMKLTKNKDIMFHSAGIS